MRLDMVKSDAEFARMMKTRSLNPEHMETQTLLRREIRVRINYSTVTKAVTLMFLSKGNTRTCGKTRGSFASFEEEDRT